ncbi:kinesin-like protein KIF26B [Trichonephila clavipes]|nr:kinesin-like protein KIF26B [Trichonephila clavipes]
MLRIKGDSEELNSSFLNIDGRKKQITVYDLSSNDQSSPAERRTGVSAPKMFAFDTIFSPDDAQAEVCSSSLPDVIQAVVGGTDGCLFVYGQSKLDWRVPPTHYWYAGNRLGLALAFTCDRCSQTALSCLASGPSSAYHCQRTKRSSPSVYGVNITRLPPRCMDQRYLH